MGKHGPCYHCGTTSTPLWRNGPPEKPILCNACGSRWRTKGSLANYTPLHARAEPGEYEEYRIPRVKSMSINNKEPKVLKRKQNHENMIRSKEIASDCNNGLLKTIDEDTSNRSSSGSAISNSESCVQFGSVEANDLTAQSVEWEHMIPSRKRTCVNRPKQSRMEKLTKDLYTILHEQQQSSHFSGSSQEDLLFESDQPMVSVEIGHGSVLIRHPSSMAQEEESEASSVTVENKANLVHDTHSCSTAFPLYMSKGEMEDNKRPGGPGMQQENVSRCKDDHEKLTILRSNNSPLCHVDLKEIVNFDVFASHLTNEEQQQLLRYLPDLDTGLLPQSFQSMFSSPKFEENLISFQKLLLEGVLDLAFSGAKTEDFDALERISLSGSDKSKWVEQYSQLKDEEAKGSKKGANLLAYNASTKLKRSHANPGTKSAMKGPGHKDLVDKGGSCFQMSLFPLPGNYSQLTGAVQSMDENPDHDLLLDVPSNNSFPEAELLYQTSHSSSSIYPQLIRP